ncbi:NADP-dependent oxidoreductase [Nocardioides sp. ChNu-153]|uniref:NADP-dependent oxidoreductase n=1 Tax=Nocardioides sp. ChNu-153 TaxID=2779364 RepID=UPI00264FD2FD|nr:NADP-dependent oxidoreductase [Nocardioides sp. ChNu-153]MDN7122139.1 NADP-dependent oxidoreductase [Nocardioides sp. ChNu-153]
MVPTTSTQVQLVRRPTGWPEPDDFRTVEVELPDLEPGEVRVANAFVSVDPYMRGRMNEGKSYIPPFALGETMTGGAVGRVVASRDDALAVGTPVLHDLGWRDVAQGPARAFRPVREVPGAPLSLHLGILGMTGLTAYVGLTRIAGLREGDTVFVSGAAGAVGTAVGQIARLLGAGRVVGSAGSPEKVALLSDKYGYDAAFDYKAGPVRDQLAEAAPDGVDLYFDNVGGEHLEAALGAMNRGGRMALCGAIAAYNADAPVPGPRNMFRIITQGLTLRGFTLGDHRDLAGEFGERMAGWFADGRIAYDETVVDGVENAVEALLTMMRGGNVGKMVVRTSD